MALSATPIIFPKARRCSTAARQKGLEGILAKRRSSVYEERRTREWLKIKITQTLDCVIGGYTEPEGSRSYFGSIVLGLYDKKGDLIHIGQAGTGFDQATLKQIWQALKKLETKRSPFPHGVEALRTVHWVKPELVAEIKFSEWTHESAEGGMKLRAPVFLRLREDKDPKECVLQHSQRVTQTVTAFAASLVQFQFLFPVFSSAVYQIWKPETRN